jgi:hypothetical protein
MAEYLNSTVAEAVTEALGVTIAAQPEDPIDFLGQYLLKLVARKEAEAQVSQSCESPRQHWCSRHFLRSGGDAAVCAGGLCACEPCWCALQESKAAVMLEIERNRALDLAKEREALEAPAKAKQEARSKEEQALRDRLAGCLSVDGALLDSLCDLLQDRLGVTAVYVCRKEPSEGPEASTAGEEDGEDEEGGPKFQLRYVGVSSSASEMRHQHVVQPKGVTFDCWKLPPAPDAGDDAEIDEDDAEAVAAREAKRNLPPPELPLVHVRNVLRDPRFKFFGMPRLGEFVAVPFRYNSLDHPDCIPPPPPPPEDAGGDESKAADDDEEAAAAAAPEAEPAPEDEGIPAGRAVEKHWAICFDSMGKDHRVSAKDIDMVKQWTEHLRAALERTEQAGYEAEFTASKQAAAVEAEAVAAIEAEAADDAAAAAEAKASRLEGGDAAPEDVKALAEAWEKMDVAAARIRRGTSALSAIASRRIAPPAECIKVLHTAARIAGWSAAELGDAGSRNKEVPFWGSVAASVHNGLVDKLASFDPEAAEPGASLRSQEAINAALEGIEGEAVKAGSRVFELLLEWSRAAGDACNAAAQKQARIAAAAAAPAEGEAAPADE